MKKIIVFYHADCPDGFGAAWAEWKKFGNRAEYLPIKANQEPNQLGDAEIKNRDVYLLDICVSPSKLRELMKNNKSVTIIDHHFTNRETVKCATQWRFDLNHSGAVLSWQHFFPKKSVPWFLSYIEDNDLWKFRLPHSVEISLWLGLFPARFETWERVARDLEKKSLRRKFAQEGKLLLRYENQIIKDILKNAYEVEFKNHRAKAVNTSVSHSQVGHLLIDKKHPIGIVWYEDGKMRKYSLRSRGSMNVSRIARQFPGGGGHKRAAGFTLPASRPFPWKIIEKKNEK